MIHENRKFNFIVSEFLMGNSGPENGLKVTTIFCQNSVSEIFRAFRPQIICQTFVKLSEIKLSGTA